MFTYFSPHGSSLIGLPFPLSFVVYCFCSCDACSDLVYIDVCSDLVFGNVCNILLPIMRCEGVMVRASASQSVDLGFIP